MYLPCWTDGLTWQEQFDCYWIAKGTSPYEKDENPPTFLSLLPIRFYNHTTSCYGVNLHYYQLPPRSGNSDSDDVRTFRILHSREVFALELWKRAAQIVADEFPLLENLQFGEQQFDGVYPITFQYPVEQVAARQEAIMRKLIDDGFSIEESLAVRCEETEHGKRWTYEGIVSLSEEEMKELFSDLPYGDLPAIRWNKQIRYPYEACEAYYKSFDARILTLGNQYRKYECSDSALEAAIERMDFKGIKLDEKDGRRLNEITKFGDSVFSDVTCFRIDAENLNEAVIAFLDACVAAGANPAVYGITGDSVLVDAAEWNEHRMTEWLLKQGVDLNIHPFLDDYYDAEHTLLDWIDHRYDEAYGDEDLLAATKKTIDLLEQYGAKREKIVY